MSTMTEALAHMEQLIMLGCEYEQALHDTKVAFELDEESADLLEGMYDDLIWAGIRDEEVDEYEEGGETDDAYALASAGFGTDEDYGYASDEY